MWGELHIAISYRQAAEAAESQGIGIWDPNYCGSVVPDAACELRILRNPDGTDSADPNKEWVKLINQGSQSVNLDGWELRSSGEEKYTFPAGTVLAPGGYVKVHPGSGTNRPNHQYWGLGRTMYASDHAESVVLFDPLGNVREWKMSPCQYSCTDPLRGLVELRVNYDAAGSDSSNPNGEWIDVVNVSTNTVDLVDYVIINDQHRYVPAGGARIPAGGRLRLYVGSGPSQGLDKYWGKPSGILRNDADEVVLRNMDGVRISRLRWPCTSGCETPDLKVLFANHDAPGTDDTNLNEEYILIRNDDPSVVDLTDWALRAGSNWYHFGAGISLQSGAILRLNSGSGSDTTTGNEPVLYWGRTSVALRNSTGEVQLIAPNLAEADCWGWEGSACDPTGSDVRASLYVTPNPIGSDTINANGETVRIKVRDAVGADLSGFRVVHNGYVYEIANNTILAQNQNLTVHAGFGNRTNHHQYWETGGSILLNNGGTVRLFDSDGLLVRELNYGN